MRDEGGEGGDAWWVVITESEQESVREGGMRGMSVGLNAFVENIPC